MSKRYTNVTKEEFLKRLNNQKIKLNSVDLLQENIDPNYKMCFIDKYGYKYSLNYNMLFEKSHAIVKSQNPYSIDNIKNFIKINGSKTEVLSKEWINANTKIKLKCEKCGRIFECRWYHIYGNKKFICNKCSMSNPYNKKNIDETKKLCQKHKYTLLENTYISRHKFDIKDKEEYKYSNCSVYSLDNRKNKFNRFSFKNTYQIENMKLYIQKNQLGVFFANENQKNFLADEYADFICCECGELYKSTWSQILGRGTSTPRIRCEKCSKNKSNLEYIVEEYLKEKNIKYTNQKRFKWCRNIRELPFDFYLDDYNTVIEVNGTQHYYENKMFQQTLEEQQKIDNYKKECCIKNNVKYVSIPFWIITQSNIESYKTIIDNIIALN